MYVFISSLSTRAATHCLMYAKRISDFRVSTWNVDCQPVGSYTKRAVYIPHMYTHLRILPPDETYRKLYSKVYRSYRTSQSSHCKHNHCSCLLHAQATSTNQQHCIHVSNIVLINNPIRVRGMYNKNATSKYLSVSL